jgi:hypothetical protein
MKLIHPCLFFIYNRWCFINIHFFSIFVLNTLKKNVDKLSIYLFIIIFVLLLIEDYMKTLMELIKGAWPTKPSENNSIIPKNKNKN